MGSVKNYNALKNYKTFFHVLYSKEEKLWQVKKDNDRTVIARGPKQEAIKEALQLAEELRAGEREVIVHKTNGTFDWRAFQSEQQAAF